MKAGPTKDVGSEYQTLGTRIFTQQPLTHRNKYHNRYTDFHSILKPNRTSLSAAMHLSGKAKQIPRGASPASDDPIHITLNSAVAEDSVIGTSPNKCKRDATAEISTKSDAHDSKINLTSTYFPSVQLLRSENPLDISSQKASLPDEPL